MATQPIPSGMAGALPYLFVDDGPAAMDWYCRYLGGIELMRMPGPDGHGLMHGEVQINGQSLMLSQAYPDWGTRAPIADQLPSSKLMLYVEDVDAAAAECAAGGATVLRAPEDMFWGDRMAELRDPFGHLWMLATHVEDVTESEINRRAAEMFGA